VIIPIFLPHLGCDRRCIYCDQGSITDVRTDDIPGLIGKMLAKITVRAEVGLYGGNIFGIKPPDLRTLFEHFENYADRISNFRISTKPLPLNDGALRLLKEKKVTVIELGMPCFNDSILESLNRGYTVEDFHRAFHLLKEEGFGVAIQVMVGLPGETIADIKKTAEEIVRLSPDYIRIYPLVVLKDTPLHRMYERGAFVPMPFEDSVDRAAHIYINALNHGIKTVKIGLTESAAIRERIVAGHYHPAFGYLVKSRIFYLAVVKNLETASMGGEIELELNNRDIPHLLGHKRANVDKFEEKGIHIAWKNADLEQGSFGLTCGSRRSKGTIFDACLSLAAST
jgi:histone acetyltransferase (RNA polymerase elongator complex component)